MASYNSFQFWFETEGLIEPTPEQSVALLYSRNEDIVEVEDEE
jgi:hypothetical protein